MPWTTVKKLATASFSSVEFAAGGTPRAGKDLSVKRDDWRMTLAFSNGTLDAAGVFGGPARTTNRIGCRSSSAAVTKAFGKPIALRKGSDGSGDSLDYQDIIFGLDEHGTVAVIWVIRPGLHSR